MLYFTWAITIALNCICQLTLIYVYWNLSDKDISELPEGQDGGSMVEQGEEEDLTQL